MFFPKYSMCVLKSKQFLFLSLNKTSYLFKEISSKPLQKSSIVSEANFPNKSHNISQSEEIHREDQENARSTSEEIKKENPESMEALKPLPVSVIQRKESADILISSDPFEQIPGPIILKKISSLWKYLPEIGCQATVSAMLSFFNIKQTLSVATVLGKPSSRPFDSLFCQHGPIVKLQGPLGADIVLIYKPEHIAKVYDQEGKYPIRSTLDSVNKCRASSRKSCGGPFNLNGIEWEEMRKALQTPLLSGIERHFTSLNKAANMLVKRIIQIKNRQNEIPENFMIEINKWGMECLCLITLGKSLGFYHLEGVTASSECTRLLQAVVDATSNFCKCESGFQLWRFLKTPSFLNLTNACEIIDGYISKYVRLAQVNLTKNKADILKQEKKAADLPFIENLLLNECMSPDEVLTCIVDLLLIGVNTTSSSLAFSLYFLAQNQRTQRTLFKEVKNVLPNRESDLKYEDLSSMKYLDACLKESLRLRMPIPILSRVIPNDIALSNFRIPKGTYVVMDVQAACLKEQNFDKSDKFIPERWFDPSNIQPFSFIPFGHGPRSCVAKHLAEVQLKTCIAKIIRSFQLEYNYGEIHGTNTVISFPDKPLKLSFTQRGE